MSQVAMLSFGEYAEYLRKAKGKSLRETAKAIGISAQFYSEIEKGRRSALTADRLDKLRSFLGLNREEANLLFNKAAGARKVSEFDFSDYIVDRDYAMSALRVFKELDATEEEWGQFVQELRERRNRAAHGGQHQSQDQSSQAQWQW